MVYIRKFGDYEESFEGSPEEIIEVINSLDGEEKETPKSEPEPLAGQILYGVMSSLGASAQEVGELYKLIISGNEILKGGDINAKRTDQC